MISWFIIFLQRFECVFVTREPSWSYWKCSPLSLSFNLDLTARLAEECVIGDWQQPFIEPGAFGRCFRS